MTTRRPLGLRGYAHFIGYRVFYRLPGRVRRRLVRTITPTYTLGAVTLLLDAGSVPDGVPGHAVPAEARMLLLRQPPGFGWSLPGGLIERGEEPRTCAARELAEETGVELAPDALTPAVPNAVVHPRGQWVDTVFVARIDPAEHPVRPDGVEVQEARWYPLSDLPRLTLPTARLVARYGIGPLADHSGDVDAAVLDPQRS
ncbi:MAG TPA: NUDIX domain-containing protein [Actinocatenispora sp.]